MRKIHFFPCALLFAMLIPAVASSQTNLSSPSGLNIELLEAVPSSQKEEVPGPAQACYNPWDSGGMNLQNRVRRLMSDPYRTGFGSETTGGTENLVVVTNPLAEGSGSYQDVIDKARPGDYIVFDSAHDVYTNGCRGNGCNISGSVTIDGSLANGKFVTLQRNDRDTYNKSMGFVGGNNIVTNILIDHDTAAAAVTIGTQENYWFNAFEIKARQDDALGIGSPTQDPENSADMVTISRYKVHGGAKGLLVIAGGSSCRGDSNLAGSDIALNQRRAHVTVIDSDLASATRNIMNNGGYVDIVGSYIHGSVENTVSRFGSQTIIRCSYVDGRTVATRTIRADGGAYRFGKSDASPSYCPQDAGVFLDNNIYRQKNFQTESADPRIDLTQSEITTGDGGHMSNGITNWERPQSGRGVFNRPYENEIQMFCNAPAPTSNAGPEFIVEDHCG